MIQLPFPHKALWPNGRAHWSTRSREFKKHKTWACTATQAAKLRGNVSVPVSLNYIVTPKTAHVIDKDNCVAAMKAYQDGIALALGIDDSAFSLPTIVFAEPKKPGSVEVFFS